MPNSLKVLSFNIHHGEGLDLKVDLERIARLIKDSDSDLVALQEVDLGLERTQKIDMPSELSRLTGMESVFSNNYSVQGGQYGNAMLSRFPIVRVTNHFLPLLTGGEQRGLLDATLVIHGQNIRFLATHFDHRRPEPDRLAAVEFIAKLIAKDPSQPIILAGDLNSTPERETYIKLREIFADSWVEVGVGNGFTIPAEKPFRRIDYVWYRGSGRLRPVYAEVIQSAASDHLPLLVEFKLVPGK